MHIHDIYTLYSRSIVFYMLVLVSKARAGWIWISCARGLVWLLLFGYLDICIRIYSIVINHFGITTELDGDPRILACR